MPSLDEVTGWTAEELAEGWRFGIWRNSTPDAKGDYVRGKDQKILRFERSRDAYAALKALGFRYHVGPERSLEPPPKLAKKRKRGAPPQTLPFFEPPAVPTAYVCPVTPDNPG